MKKNLYRSGGGMPALKKLTLIMKLNFFIMFVAVLQVSASHVSAQKTHVDLKMKDASLAKILDAIEDQSEVYFFYNKTQVDENQKADVDFRDLTVEEALNHLSDDLPITYEVVGKNIIIKPRDSNEQVVIQQPKSVSGKITDFSGSPLPGASVVVKGTNQGTVTDTDGHYSLTNIPTDAILIFSFIGMQSQEIPIEGRMMINVVMEEEEHAINEVVITALGIERSKKTLTYATQQVNTEDLTTIKDVSLGNALAGKIAGVAVTSSTGASGVSGDPRIIIRGNRSIQNNNQPLIVVDGIPYSTEGGGLSSINPDDIQSMNVLKGPAASALYGSSANNGVIVVTTKKGKSGKPKIEVNSVSNFDFPYLYPDFQDEYGQGTGGDFSALSYSSSWGPKMNGQTVTDWTGNEVKLTPQKNNVKDFFKTGYNFSNSFSYSAGNEKSTSYFSYSNTLTRGLLEDNKMTRHNFNLRLTTELIKNLNMDFKITFFRQQLDDKPVTGDDIFSPMFQLIKMPRSIRTADIKAGSYYDENGSLKQLTWTRAADGTTATGTLNPYWSMDGYENPSTVNKVNTYLALRYNFTSWLYIQLRGGMNITNSDEEEKTYWDSQYIYSGKGNYYTRFSKNQDINGDVLLVFNKDLTKDFRLGLNLGAEIKDSQARAMEADAGGLTAENKFALDYASSLTSDDSESRIQKQSVYGMGSLSFRDYLFLNFTARNDWSSTLPSPYDYFYPSVGLTGIVSDILDLPGFISFAKVRGSYAEVGNDAQFASIFNTYSAEATGPAGTFYPSSTRMALDLIPEKTKSWEAGAELRFLENRFGIDLTWYKSNTYNQLMQVTTPSSSGYSSSWINAGNIQNKGIELMVSGTPIKTSDFEWNVNVNFSRNKNKIIELTETMDAYEISSPGLDVGDTWAIVGRPYGEVYTPGFVRNDEGKIVVDELGLPEIDTSENPMASKYLGNFNYDWQSGLMSNIQYKNWTISFLVDLNYGGVRQSGTEAAMLESGTSKESLIGREDGILIDGVKEDGTPNDIRVSAETYAAAMGGRISSGGCGEVFNHKATNSRLREFSLGYTIPVRSNFVRSLKVSAVGRNLFYIYNACDWFDPDVSFRVTTNGQGGESAFLPGTRTLGFNLKVTF